MEPEPTRPVRKVRFAPKAPVRKPVKKAEPKDESFEDQGAAQARELLRRVNETAGRGKAKAEKKSSQAQVAFGHGVTSNFLRSYGTPKRASGDFNGSGPKMDKEYKDPWNYYSYYPVTLPLRRPYSGDPVLLDEEEFGVDAANTAYDEDAINPAEDLGLMEENDETRMIFLQLPATLPLTKRSATAEGNETASSSKQSKPVRHSEKGCSLEELPPGFMGKLLVYKSGKVKLKVGDTLYDVSSGSDCSFVNEVVAINTKEKHCSAVGELNTRAIVTPDIDSLFSNI